jgi:hypothetical protein
VGKNVDRQLLICAVVLADELLDGKWLRPLLSKLPNLRLLSLRNTGLVKVRGCGQLVGAVERDTQRVAAVCVGGLAQVAYASPVWPPVRASLVLSCTYTRVWGVGCGMRVWGTRSDGRPPAAPPPSV